MVKMSQFWKSKEPELKLADYKVVKMSQFWPKSKAITFGF